MSFWEELGYGLLGALLGKKKAATTQEPIRTGAVLLLAHGTPDTLGEMAEYLKLVTGGRAMPTHIVKELQHRYAEIGLRYEPVPEGPHLTRWTLKQAELLGQKLGGPVYVGMRNWKPFIADTVAQMIAEGNRHVTAVCLAPQNSRTSVGLYKRALTDAANNAMQIKFIAGWAEHPLLVRAFAEKMRAALVAEQQRGGRVAALFTAHAVPCRTIQTSNEPVKHHGMVLATEPDTYAIECKATAARVADTLRELLPEQDTYFSFQSQGVSGGPWIGPPVEETLGALKQQGYDAVVLQPIGFLCDHVEILYDIDVAFQQQAKELGLRLSRAESLNDSPTLIAALEDLVQHPRDEVFAGQAVSGTAEVVTRIAETA